jgi:hypothetical protein
VAVEERPPRPSVPRRTEKPVRPGRTVLAPEPSAALREQLLADITELQSADDAADWVHKNLAAKNTLITDDASLVEAGFRDRLAAIEVAAATGQGEANSRPAVEAVPPVGEPFLTAWTPPPRLRSSCPQPPAHAADALRRKPSACATRNTASSSPPSPASSAAGRPPRRITFASPNRARSAAKSATNTRSLSAGSITGSSTVTAMRLHGGPRSTSTHCPSLSSCGERRAQTTPRKVVSPDVV